MQKLSIRFDVLLALLIAGLFFIMTLCLTFLISHLATDRLKKEVGMTLSATAYQLSDKLDHYMWSRTAEVNVLRTLPTIQEQRDLNATRDTLEQLQKQIPDFSWIGVIGPDGQVLASTGKILEGQSIKERPVFQEAQDKPFIGDVHDAVLLAKLLRIRVVNRCNSLISVLPWFQTARKAVSLRLISALNGPRKSNKVFRVQRLKSKMLSFLSSANKAGPSC